MSLTQSPKTAISAASSSSLSLKSTQTPSPKKPTLPAWLLASPSDSTSSGNRRICRICQMHDGEMVRPCDCAGTMGDVHEECLTKWVNMSNKQNCEICKSMYSKSGEEFKPFKEWTKPKFDISVFIHILLVVIFIFLIAYVVSVMNERHFYSRIITHQNMCRPDDTGRILLIVIMSIAIANNVYTLFFDLLRYLKRQRQIRFVNKHS